MALRKVKKEIRKTRPPQYYVASLLLSERIISHAHGSIVDTNRYENGDVFAYFQNLAHYAPRWTRLFKMAYRVYGGIIARVSWNFTDESGARPYDTGYNMYQCGRPTVDLTSDNGEDDWGYVTAGPPGSKWRGDSICRDILHPNTPPESGDDWDGRFEGNGLPPSSLADAFYDLFRDEEERIAVHEKVSRSVIEARKLRQASKVEEPERPYDSPFASYRLGSR